MKKMIFGLFVFFLMGFAAVRAQAADSSLPELNFGTVSGIFTWGDSFEDVYTRLSRYDMEVQKDDENGFISADSSSGEEQFLYNFYFDDETAVLTMIDCFSVLSEEVALTDVLEMLDEAYGLTEMKNIKMKNSPRTSRNLIPALFSPTAERSSLSDS